MNNSTCLPYFNLATASLGHHGQQILIVESDFWRERVVACHVAHYSKRQLFKSSGVLGVLRK
jgi:hypothetical protein